MTTLHQNTGDKIESKKIERTPEMKIILSNDLLITEASEPLRREIINRLSFENPKWIENNRLGYWNGSTPRTLEFFHENGNGLAVPRGFTVQFIAMARRAGVPYQIEDNRRVLPEIDFAFAGTLKGYQEEAVKEVMIRDFNFLQAPTGSGKTIMAMSVIAERRQPSLVIVHSKELLNQWQQRIETFLNIPKAEIGQIGNGKMKNGERITVGIINSIYPIAGKIKDYFGHIIIDECHRCPSRTFTDAVTAFDCRYMLGLSATPYRRDGLTKLIGWHLGRQVAVNQSDLTENDIIQDIEIVTRGTDFTTNLDASEEYSRVMSELTEDEDRNRLIVNDVVKEVSSNAGTCLVLTDRRGHCETLGSMLSKKGITADVLTGEVSNGARTAIVERLSAGHVRVLIATGQLIGEGFDSKELSTLFLASPIKFDGRLRQYLGRILRPSIGKDKAKIYDYVDKRVPVLAASARARQRVYQQN